MPVPISFGNARISIKGNAGDIFDVPGVSCCDIALSALCCGFSGGEAVPDRNLSKNALNVIFKSFQASLFLPADLRL